MSELAKATLGGGCFWCLEAPFAEMDGVTEVIAGYAGGWVEDPSYEDVCAGETGHAEVVQIEYDPQSITYEKLLEVFFALHDPTQHNRQGADVGSQYRSIILFHDASQRDIAAKMIDRLESSYDDDIVTEITPLETFYRAEEHHQQYFKKNPNAPYCRVHVAPKVEQIRSMDIDAT